MVGEGVCESDMSRYPIVAKDKTEKSEKGTFWAEETSSIYILKWKRH